MNLAWVNTRCKTYFGTKNFGTKNEFLISLDMLQAIKSIIMRFISRRLINVSQLLTISNIPCQKAGGGGPMARFRPLIGFLIGFATAFAFHYFVLRAMEAEQQVTLIVASIAGVLGATYSALAYQRSVYAVKFFSVLGYLLDVTWSWLNTVAAFLVWIPACAMAGEFVQASDLSRRSGTFVYTKNPRGGGYDATTIGMVIGGGWSSHEEVHTWQARIFGPLYMPVYLLSLLLNLFARLMTGKLGEIVQQAYYRICFEDWAYSGGGTTDKINWASWIVWFFVTLLFASMAVLLIIGIVTSTILLVIVSILVLLTYSFARAFFSAPARPF
jgi:hypothetical protein